MSLRNLIFVLFAAMSVATEEPVCSDSDTCQAKSSSLIQRKREVSTRNTQGSEEALVDAPKDESLIQASTDAGPKLLGKGKCLKGKIKNIKKITDALECVKKCEEQDGCTHFTQFKKSCVLFKGECSKRKDVQFGDTYEMP